MSNNDRRRFLKLAAVTLTAPAAIAAMTREASAQDLPHQDEADPTASALGYKHDTTKVDDKKFPNHKPDQTCAGCNLALGKPGDAWLPCTICPGKSVNAKGWCSAWVKKAAKPA